MDKKSPNDKILDLIRSLQAGQAEDPNMPEHIREMMRNAQASGAHVLALNEEQLRSLGPEVMRIIDDGLSLAISPNRDLSDPRYALGNKFAKELADREFELMRLSKAGAPGHVAIRLMALNYGNVDEIMNIATRKAEEDVENTRPTLTTLAMLKTLGISNIFDALAAGKDRLRWHGVPSKALHYIDQFYNNIAFVVSKRLEIPVTAVKIITDIMANPAPLAPLPPEKVFNSDFKGDFFRNLLPEANGALDALIAAGFEKLEDVFAKSSGLTELEELSGLSEEQMTDFCRIIDLLDDVSVEALDAVVAMLPDDGEDAEMEAQRLRQAEIQPVITLDDPVVLAALGQNLVTTLDIAGVTDLHEVTGLRPSEAGNAIRKELTEPARVAIRDLGRFMNQECDCESCRHFKQVYLEINPAVKLALRMPKNKPTLH